MPCHRTELEDREKQYLAPCAQLSSQSRGRKFTESPPDWRTEYQRDRDRIIHARAFRRLEYKTQVFINGAGDHLRTRLTHTMEVTAIARNIARALRLNEDLTEAVALAHDLGHSPFGHKGEAVLDQLMKEHGGFEHNRQTLRVVEELEQKYPTFRGLNLSWEVLEGLAKHLGPDEPPRNILPFTALSPSLEAQVANLADEIAYYSHDIDDGLEADLLNETELAKKSAVWKSAAESVKRQFGELSDESRRYFTIRCIIDDQVKNVVTATERRIQEEGISSADEVRRHSEPLVKYDSQLRAENLELRQYLYENVYYNPQVFEPNRRATEMLEQLFRYYWDHPDQLGDSAQKRAQEIGWPRVICDHLASMTDRYVVQDYQKRFELLR